MKLFEDILGTKVDEDAEEVKLGEIIDGELNFGDESGTVRDKSARPVAKLKTDLNPGSMDITHRLVIPVDMWDKVEVVCDGNAVEVTTEPAGEGRYRVKRKLRSYKPAVVENEETIELREFETTKQFIEWIESLGTDEVEALRQIYYDRWNFESNDTKTRMYYELLEEEKKGRKQ